MTKQDSEGRSALLYAARRGHVAIIHHLLDSLNEDATARINLVDLADETGLTPLMASALRGQHEALCLLLDAGATVGARDTTGMEALHAAASGGHRDCCETLLRSGARPDSLDGDGCMPAELAANDECRALLQSALDDLYEHWSEKSYDSAQDDRPWH